MDKILNIWNYLEYKLLNFNSKTSRQTRTTIPKASDQTLSKILGPWFSGFPNTLFLLVRSYETRKIHQKFGQNLDVWAKIWKNFDPKFSVSLFRTCSEYMSDLSGIDKNKRVHNFECSGSTRHKFEHVTCERIRKKKTNETL